MRLGHVVHWTPGLAAAGLLFSLRVRYRPTSARATDHMPCSGLRAARPFAESGRGATPPGQARVRASAWFCKSTSSLSSACTSASSNSSTRSSYSSSRCLVVSSFLKVKVIPGTSVSHSHTDGSPNASECLVKAFGIPRNGHL